MCYHHNQDDQKDYNDFMLKFANKIREIEDDFQKLSPQNKERVGATMQNMVKQSVVLKILNNMYYS